MALDQPFAPAPGAVSIVDLFAGPGGLDVAAEWLGLPAVGVEWDPDACATRAAAGLHTVERDVRDVGPGAFPGASVLAGGPPCQTFTVAGTGVGRRALDRVLELVALMADGRDVAERLDTMDDVRTGLVLEPLRWTLDAVSRDEAYEVVVLEQVPAVLPVWEAMAAVLEGVGYRTDTGILRTEQFGVPQTRRRAILVARRGEQPHLPEPTHRPYRSGVDREQGDPRLRPWETMGGTLDRPGPFAVVSNYGTGGDPRARGRRTSQEPSATVTGKIRRNRVIGRGGATGERFTNSEAGLLQTFPHDYPWSGNDIGQQIGNAIPPRLAVHVLAAALDIGLDADALDECVRASWRDAARAPLGRRAADRDLVGAPAGTGS
ncbi:DNA cytosine methyltransferase [Pseudonocardia spirodelae]|uniref:DNA (cytosine-5-)-methyltransferase n=1 Tax=Pseudonocardia spirodelae TaxID=3133431 RepID=A0ABU8TA97_9PSEU